MSNSPLNPSDVPNGSQPPLREALVVLIVVDLRRAVDAIERAKDALPDPGMPFEKFRYFETQIGEAYRWIQEADQHGERIFCESPDLENPDAVGDQPPTADMVPNVPVQDVTEGGGA